MDNREVKFILSAYRPGGQDANDPRFAEALEQTRRDPMLERWFQDSIAFDTAVTENLHAVAAPPDLRENILAGVKMSRPPLHWSHPFIKWAVAAAMILSATLGRLIWYEARPAHLAGWQGEALRTISSLVAGQSKFDAQSHSGADLIAWLKTNRGPVVERLPKNLETLESLGCKTFSWDGTPISVICFMRPDGGLIHVVTTVSTPATYRSAKAEPTFVRQGEWATATWREGDRIYMLALEGSGEQLRVYL